MLEIWRVNDLAIGGHRRELPALDGHRRSRLQSGHQGQASFFKRLVRYEMKELRAGPNWRGSPARKIDEQPVTQPEGPNVVGVVGLQLILGGFLEILRAQRAFGQHGSN